MTDTQRTSREKAKRMHFAAQMLDSEHATADMQQLVTDYLAALDVLERITAVHLGSDVAHRRELERARAFLAATEQETP